MYDVPPQLWISVVEMYMEGPASRWYQSLAPKLPYLTWDSFCHLLHDRFDHDQHNTLLRQLFNIRQNTSISAYVKAFSELVDQLTSYLCVILFTSPCASLMAFGQISKLL
jgi:hypothetical protein